LEGVEGLVPRIEGLSDVEPNDSVTLNTVVGKEARPPVRLSSLPERFFDIERAAVLGKSQDQVRRWRNSRIMAFKNLVEVIGDKDLSKLTRDDALRFRDWWQDRLLTRGNAASSANKDISYISSTVKRVVDRERLSLVNPFTGLKFKEIKKTVRRFQWHGHVKSSLLRLWLGSTVRRVTFCRLYGVLSERNMWPVAE
jgi:hypothetical protein